MPRTLVSLIVTVAFLLVGALGYRWVVQSAPQVPPAPPRDLGAVPVTTRLLALGPATLTVHGYGTLLASRTARIAPEVGGVLVAVHDGWRTGAAVAAGTELFAVDIRELELEIVRVDAQLVQARSAVTQAGLDVVAAEAARELAGERRAALEREQQRMLRLLDEGFGQESLVDKARVARSQAELDEREAQAAAQLGRERGLQAQARVRELQSTLELASMRRDKASVRAPFDGHLVGRAPAVGSTVVVGLPLVELIDVTTLHLSIPVPAEELEGMVVGLPALVRVPAREGLELVGSVGAVGVAADPETRTVSVEIDVPNLGFANGHGAANGHGVTNGGGGTAGESLAAGQFAEAEIEVRTLTGVLLIERAHLTYQDGKAWAYVWSEGPDGPRAEARSLELGPGVGESFVVLAGLVPGERLITGPLRQLTPDARVREMGAAGVRATGPARPDETGPARPGETGAARAGDMGAAGVREPNGDGR
ncbi:MAG: efflux RND transporter periplasmic adaptor subunit [Planctomycetota bacterium]